MKTEHGEMFNLNTIEITEILQRGYLGHLGCFDEDEVYIVPISFVYENGFIYSHSRIGKKIKMMRKHPKICIQVEEIKNYFDWRSVIAWGKYEELKGDDSARAMRLIIKKIVESEHDRQISSLEIGVKAMLENSIIYRMKVEKTSGRYEAFE